MKEMGGRKRSPQMEDHTAKKVEGSQGQTELFSSILLPTYIKHTTCALFNS